MSTEGESERERVSENRNGNCTNQLESIQWLAAAMTAEMKKRTVLIVAGHVT